MNRRESEERWCQRMLSKVVSLLLLRLKVTRSPSSILHFSSTLWNCCKGGLYFFFFGGGGSVDSSLLCTGFCSCRFSSCGELVYLPRGMWDLSSQTRDWTCIPCIGRLILNPWNTREVVAYMFKMNLFFSTFCWLSSGLCVWESLWNMWAQYPCSEDFSPFARQENKRHTIRPWLPRLCYFHEFFTLNNHKWFRVRYNSSWSDKIMYKWYSEIPVCNFPRYQWNLVFNFGMTILYHVLKTYNFFFSVQLYYMSVLYL